MKKPHELVIVLDFGAQYAQLIARRVREQNVYCEVWPYDSTLEEVQAASPKAIIFSGGPASVYAEGAPRSDERLLAAGIPILGICYGMQLMSLCLGGNVRRAERREYGKATFRAGASPLFTGLEGEMQVWMSHGDSVLAPPSGFSVIGQTGNTPVAAIGDPARGLYGVQFHPEVVHTPRGTEVLRNFLFKVAGCTGEWTMESYITEATADIRAKVGENGRALCALSGGVDSSVAAALVHRAIGDRLTCVFVNNGLLRQGEPEQVIETFRRNLKMNLIYVDATDRFLKRLRGVAEPERKRKIIGEEFVRVFEEEAIKLEQQTSHIDFLVQGTIYPDVIESGTRTAATIKTHHNVGGMPSDVKFKLVEPLRNLFKDEVRQVGEQLGLPEEIVWRHPFPGPGLGIRVLGAVTRPRLEVLRQADAIAIEEIRRAGLYRELWQAFAVLSNQRSVGVMGDERTYGYTVVLRAVTARDAMTADWARLPYDLLERISSRMMNEIKGVTRLVYDVTSKPPATIEWE